MRADLNELRRLLASGQITEADLAGMTLSGKIGGTSPMPAPMPEAAPMPQRPVYRPPSEQEAFAAAGEVGDLPMGSMRNEQTGRVTYFRPGGGGSSARPYPEGAGGEIPRYRLIGADGGRMVDLGEGQGAIPPVDVKRGMIDMPGLGKGYYTADGKSAVITNADGSKTRVLLGYDHAASQKSTATDLAIQKARAELEQTAEQTGLLRDKRAAMVAAANAPTATDAITSGPPTQKQLEERYGKPDKGTRWTVDGRLEPLPGGEVEEGAKIAAEKAQEAISGIDAMIGRRDPTGALSQGAAAHPGFSKAVGFGVPRWAQMAGTEARDFTARLDQLKGGAFLAAFESLKGGGQITEVEGKKATDAITRMNDAQSEAEFVKAAMEFRGVLDRGMRRANGRLGAPGQRPQPAMDAAEPAPAGGGVPPPEQRRLGQAYDTPRGRLVWLGNGWRAP